MSDPLSIAASVAGVASLGCAIAKGFYQIADDMSVAGHEVRIYAREIDAFTKLLPNVQRTVDELTCSAKEIAEIKIQVKEILDNCDCILKPLQEVQDGLLPLLQHFRDSPSKMLQVVLRIRWTFASKGKVLFYREVLQRQHQMLDTHLTRAMLISQEKRKNPELVVMLHASLENSATALNHTIASPTAAQDQLYAQLQLGFSSEGGPNLWSAASGGGLSPPPDKLPMRPRSAQGVVTSTALVTSTQSSTFGPGQGPALTALTEQERQGVLRATSLDIDANTMTEMERMLNDAENAELKTVRMVYETLGRGNGGSKTQDATNNSFQDQRGQLRSSVALARCGPSVMGLWAQTTKRVFRPRGLRFEVQFEAPVIFVCPPSNVRGPVKAAEVWHIDGSEQSLRKTRTEIDEGQFARATMNRPQYVADNERATWVQLLRELQRMERDSQQWAMNQYRHNPPRMRIPQFTDHTLCAAVQARPRTWDTMPDGVKKPYATTTICHLVEIAAMLGIYWREFDRSANKYRAEGNGFMLTGSSIPNLGIVFTFQIWGKTRFEDNRIVPNDSIKELAFGVVPTIFRTYADKRRSVFPTEQPTDLTTLKLGSADELAETFLSLGCNSNVLDCIRDETKKHGHLFPMAFEILGMLGETFYIPDSCFRFLPNPTFYNWDRKYFNMGMLLHEYKKKIMDENLIFFYSKHIADLQTMAEKVDVALRTYQKTMSGDNVISLRLLDTLHETLEKCDSYLKAVVHRESIEIVLREHFQELLKLVNNEGGYEDANEIDDYPSTLADPSNQGRGRLRNKDLMAASPEQKQEKLMDIYFAVLLPRVVLQAVLTLRAQSHPLVPPGSSSTASLLDGSPAPLTIHVQLHDEDEQQHQQSPPRRFTVDRIRESQVTEVWCSLVLRMLCWLLLHDFDSKDVQKCKSELVGSRLPVYIV